MDQPFVDEGPKTVMLAPVDTTGVGSASKVCCHAWSCRWASVWLRASTVRVIWIGRPVEGSVPTKTLSCQERGPRWRTDPVPLGRLAVLVHASITGEYRTEGPGEVRERPNRTHC